MRSEEAESRKQDGVFQVSQRESRTLTDLWSKVQVIRGKLRLWAQWVAKCGSWKGHPGSSSANPSLCRRAASRTEVIPKVTQQVGVAGRPDLQMPRWVYLYLLGLSFGSIHHWSLPWSEMKVTQSCPTICNPVDCSPPGSSVHGFLQNTGVGCHALLQGIFTT